MPVDLAQADAPALGLAATRSLPYRVDMATAEVVREGKWWLIVVDGVTEHKARSIQDGADVAMHFVRIRGGGNVIVRDGDTPTSIEVAV